jgi:hypothetical protein
MKRFLVNAMVLCGILVFAIPASSYTINSGTVVGGLDTYLARIDLANSGDATELNWAQNYLRTYLSDPTLVLTMDKNVSSEYTFTIVDGQTSIYAAALADEPEWYFIKVGKGNNDPPYTHYLFQNNALLSYAVFDIDSSGFDIKNIGKISHIGELGGGVPVPEPGTMMLLGSGLVGLAGWGRKKYRK